MRSAACCLLPSRWQKRTCLVGALEADALYTSEAGIGCRVVTADCLPVLLCRREGNQIAAVHAGWRGLAAGILEATLAAMGSQPETLLAWIGPAISQACYEVGGEVREAFLAAGTPAQREALDACFRPQEGKFLADLPGIARIRLASQGVLEVHGGCPRYAEIGFAEFGGDGA